MKRNNRERARSLPTKPSKPKGKCFFFSLLGTCRNGSLCQYWHERPKARYVPKPIQPVIDPLDAIREKGVNWALELRGRFLSSYRLSVSSSLRPRNRSPKGKNSGLRSDRNRSRNTSAGYAKHICPGPDLRNSQPIDQQMTTATAFSQGPNDHRTARLLKNRIRFRMKVAKEWGLIAKQLVGQTLDATQQISNDY